MLHNKYFDIMKEFHKGYSRKIYGRELVGKVPLSQKNIALTLVELEKEGILKSINSGNRRYYELNFSNPLLIQNVFIFEKINELIFLERNKKLIDFFNDFDVKIACVFGSYAKGNNKKSSDLDLFLVGKVDSLKIKKLGIEYCLDVQVFNVSFSDFVKMIKDKKELLSEILENHILIKGGDLFLKEVLKWLA